MNTGSGVDDLMRELIALVPVLRLISFQGATVEAPDWVGRVALAEQTWTILVEWKEVGQPRHVRAAINQLLQYLRAAPNPSYGVIVAPFLSPQSAELCSEAGLGYADFAGNARIAFGSVYIERRAAENPFLVRREQRSLFTRKAGRVLRTLLTPPLRAWRVAELKEATGVSLGQVSNVRRLLLDRDLAISDAGGLRLTRPLSLARDLSDAYKPPKRKTYHTVLHGQPLEHAIRKTLEECGHGAHAVLASFSAAEWIAPYARQASRFFYADQNGTTVLQRNLGLERSSRGENIVILDSPEDDVFAGRIEPAPQVWTTGFVQTWLDLNASGDRGREAAEHLATQELYPEWKDAAS